jgi:hypothetical protein
VKLFHRANILLSLNQDMLSSFALLFDQGNVIADCGHLGQQMRLVTLRLENSLSVDNARTSLALQFRLIVEVSLELIELLRQLLNCESSLLQRVGRFIAKSLS